MPDKDKPTPPKKPTGKVFDVSRPGKAMATPTSRPVISGHQPEAQSAQTSVSGVGEDRPLLNRRKLQIFPLTDGEKAEAAQAPKDAPAKDELEPEKPAEEASAPVPNSKPENEEIKAPADVGADGAAETSVKTVGEKRIEPPEPEAPAEPEQPKPEAPKEPEAEETKADSSVESEEPEARSSVPGGNIPKPEAPKEPEVEPSPLADAKVDSAVDQGPKIEPLFDNSGKVVVSHHNHHKGSAVGVVLLLLLILVLAAAALDLMLDLEVLKLEGIPHTDFFK